MAIWKSFKVQNHAGPEEEGWFYSLRLKSDLKSHCSYQSLLWFCCRYSLNIKTSFSRSIHSCALPVIYQGVWNIFWFNLLKAAGTLRAGARVWWHCGAPICCVRVGAAGGQPVCWTEMSVMWEVVKIILITLKIVLEW